MRGSISTTATRFACSRMRTVRLPVPGPTSSTTSVGFRFALSTMPCATSGFLRMCWPNRSVLKMGFLVETAAVCWCVRGDALVACVRAPSRSGSPARGIAADEKHAAKGKKGPHWELNPGPLAIRLVTQSENHTTRPYGRHTARTVQSSAHMRSSVGRVLGAAPSTPRSTLVRHESPGLLRRAPQGCVSSRAPTNTGETFELRADRACPQRAANGSQQRVPRAAQGRDQARHRQHDRWQGRVRALPRRAQKHADRRH